MFRYLMGFSKKRNTRLAATATSLLYILALGALGASPAVAEPQVVDAASVSPDQPAATMTAQASAQSVTSVENDYQAPVSSIFENQNFEVSSSPLRTWSGRALNLITRQVFVMLRRSVDDPFQHYRDGINNVQDNYQRIEEFAGLQGIDQSSFREGLAISTATAVTTLSALHFINPVGISHNLMSTGIKVGYDVSQLDDPKIFMTYNDRYRFGADRNGLRGSFKDDSGRIYTAVLDVFKLRATVRVIF